MLNRILIALATLAALGLAGCNTAEGLGKDLQILGDKIEGKAKEKK